MNLADKLTISRIGLTFVILSILLIPWEDFGLVWPSFYVNGSIVVELKYIVAGVLFIIACITDYLDGKIARKAKKTTDFGATLDAIADKILVNGILIVLAYQGFISVLIPVIIVLRDTFVDALRVLSAKNKVIIKANKWGKVKTIFMMVALSLVLFYNLPFEIWGIYMAEILLSIATILSVLSGIIYYIQFRYKIKWD